MMTTHCQQIFQNANVLRGPRCRAGKPVLAAVATILCTITLQAQAVEMASLPQGEYRPLYSSQASPLEWVKAFRIDTTPVTNLEFAEFIRQHPQWSPDKIQKMFAEEGYLKHWLKENDQWMPKTIDAQSPVSNVSWFAAQAYCKAQGKRLPTIAEWEYAARASETKVDATKDKAFTQKILNWYAKPATASLPAIKQDKPNYWGIYDMHGLIWEWTQDFNATVSSKLQTSNIENVEVDGRTVTLDLGAFCGAGAEGVADPSDYAAFMRYGFRSSLKAPFTLDTLGFRCAMDGAANP